MHWLMTAAYLLDILPSTEYVLDSPVSLLCLPSLWSMYRAARIHEEAFRMGKSVAEFVGLLLGHCVK